MDFGWRKELEQRQLELHELFRQVVSPLFTKSPREPLLAKESKHKELALLVQVAHCTFFRVDESCG